MQSSEPENMSTVKKLDRFFKDLLKEKKKIKREM